MADSEMESKPRAVSRRKFGKRAALAAAAGTLSAPLQNASLETLPASDQAAVNAKHANIVRKYGDRLTPAQRRRARETLVQHQLMLMRIREFALDNGDAPATGLRLYPADIEPGSGPAPQRPQ